VILIAGFAVVALSVVALGGRLSLLPTIRLRHPELIIATLAGQILVINVLPRALPLALAAALHLATYALAVAFVLVNRHIRGLWLVMAGGGCNLAAIAANGGEMPAARSALAAAGIRAGSGFHNSGAVANPHLAFLGDIFAVPRGWPLPNVFSIGDVVLLAGAFVVLHHACASRLTRSRAGPGRPVRPAADPALR